MIFGEAASVLLASQRPDPCVLRKHQFAFDFPTLESALEDIVGGTAVAISPAQSRPEGAGEARYELRARTVIDAPLDQTFAFFSKAANLGVITPAAMRFSIQGRVPPMAAGAVIDYRVRVGPLPFVGARASPRGSRAEALPIFKRRARTASGGTITHVRPMARAR